MPDGPVKSKALTALGDAEDVPPDPAAMIESMRAFGYGLPSAIADLVDNSITAGARNIWIGFGWAGDDSRILILDDGAGMDATELRSAMRLGSRSAREERAPRDLGRFGLGLKTAAFSQGRSLTVASRRGPGDAAVRRWDLDHVTETSSWSLQLTPRPGSAAFLLPLEKLRHGTAVLIERLDRLAGETDTEDTNAHDHFLQQADRVDAHLGMVFHRFLTGSGRVRIQVNKRPVEPWDPFLIGKRHVQLLPEERFSFDGGTVTVRPHVLPHFSKLDAADHRRGAGDRGWNDHQGFYVYRAKRLIVAGDWLSLPRMQKEEHYKLARIQIDIDNSMDLAWQIDVRKATARIPSALRIELRRIAIATRRHAAEAYRYRGKRLARGASANQTFVWVPHDSTGSVSYRIDRAHPLLRTIVQNAESTTEAVHNVLQVVEETLPIMSRLMDCREEPDSVRAPYDGREAEVRVMMRDVHRTMVDAGSASTDALALIARLEPFDSHPELVAAFAEELTDEP
jgi:hypothetical protein